MSLCITGGAGFVGSSLARRYRTRYPDRRVVAFDNLKRRGAEFNLADFRGLDIEFDHGDVRIAGDLAAIPDAVSDQDAATLPVAGLTALYALERCERILGNRVLITGASGGVGYFACQLGLLMGGHIVAHLRRPDYADLVRGTGVQEVVVSEDAAGIAEHGRFRSSVDGVGGPLLASLIAELEEDGRAILYGVSAGPTTPLAIRDLMFTGDGRVEGFYLYRESDIEYASRGLARLLGLVAGGQLVTHVPVTGSWENIGETAAGLIARDFPGKAVLTI